MNLTYIILPILAFALSLVLLKPLRKFAILIQLVDTPNARKVHTSQIPLIGGLLLMFSTCLSLLVSAEFWSGLPDNYMVMVGGFILLIMGVIDDKMDLRASLKLIIQIALAYFVFASGIRIESLYGIFGINEISVPFQYLMTLLIIVGVVNAFNLMDGIDGLVAGLSIIAFGAFNYLAYINGNMFLVVLFTTMLGALLGFLKFNLSTKQKIFMGDAGSLALGYILVVSGIMLLQSANGTPNQPITLAVIVGVLALPVADSLRVYYGRIKEGNSPFKADKTHLHHLVLLLKVKHKMASVFIVLFSISLIILSILFGTIFSMTATILFILFFFVIISSVLELNRQIGIWQAKIKEIEQLY